MNLTIDELNLLLKLKIASDSEKAILMQDFLLKTKNELANLNTTENNDWQDQQFGSLKNIGEEVHRLRVRLQDKIGTPNAVNNPIAQNKAMQ
jgi:hypothetical protein